MGLSTRPDGTPHTLGSWRYPLRAFGITDGPGAATEPAGPPRPRRPGRRRAARCARTDPALWLRLVPPYGYLGAVPWERALAASGLPMLRVPDRLPAAVDPGSVFTMAIAVCARTRIASGRCPRRAACSTGCGRRSRCAASAGRPRLRRPRDGRAAVRELDPRVGWQHVHDPADARRATQTRAIDLDADRSRLRALGRPAGSGPTGSPRVWRGGPRAPCTSSPTPHGKASGRCSW